MNCETVMCDHCRVCFECGFQKPLDDMRLALKDGRWFCDMCVRKSAGERPHYPGKRIERDVEESG